MHIEKLEKRKEMNIMAITNNQKIKMGINNT